MLTLQLKRTQRSIEEDNIRLLVLAKGEPFVLFTADNKKLFFIGDGVSSLGELYNNGKYVLISNYVTAEQILAIPEDALPSWVATQEQLDELKEYVNAKYNDTSGDLSLLNSKIDLSKVYSTICHTASNNANKEVQISMPQLEPAQGEDEVDYSGLTLVIKFDYGNNANAPLLHVKNQYDREIIVAPMKIGGASIEGVFNWKNNDTLIFTYYDGAFNMAGDSAARTISNWCSEYNTTLIDGSKIYTGSITADKIASRSITADQIAVGSLPADVLNSQFSTALNNLNFIEQQAALSKQVICTCETPGDSLVKEVYLNGEAALSVGIINEAPMYGTSLVIKFTHKNLVDGCSLRVVLDGFPFPPSENNAIPIGYYDSDYHPISLHVPEEGEADPGLNWNDDEVRVLVYDGSYWIIQPPSSYLKRAADWCLENNQTFIKGGTIVTGRISCAQIDAGYIDASKISFSYYSTDSDNNIVNYGGFDHFDGSTGTTTTKGVIMYGADRDNYNIRITNSGTVLDIEKGRIEGWDSSWRFNAFGGIYIGNLNGSAYPHSTTSVNIGNTNCTTTINGKLKLNNIPTSSSGLPSGSVYIENNVLKIVS